MNRHLERQFIQVQKMKAMGMLTGGIAHDFNNILLVIMGNAELARLNAREGKAGEKNSEGVLKACERAKRLGNQILQFSRQTDINRMPL